MIFWLFVVLSILAVIVEVAASRIGWDYERNSKFREWLYHTSDTISVVSIVCAITFLLVVLIMFLLIVIIQTTVEGTRAKNEQRYETLIYKAQNEKLRDDFGITNKDYLQEVQEWNEDFAEYQALSDNFWIGIFYPKKVYDGMSIISLEDVKMRNK